MNRVCCLKSTVFKQQIMWQMAIMSATTRLFAWSQNTQPISNMFSLKYELSMMFVYNVKCQRHFVSLLLDALPSIIAEAGADLKALHVWLTKQKKGA